LIAKFLSLLWYLNTASFLIFRSKNAEFRLLINYFYGTTIQTQPSLITQKTVYKLYEDLSQRKKVEFPDRNRPFL